MTFRLIYVFLSSWNLVDSIDLKCEFVEDGHPWGKVCRLIDKLPIEFGTERNGYKFTGLTEQQRNETKVIQFLTPQIDFVPKEVLTTFPNLKGIDFSHQNVKILHDSYLRNLLKFLGTKIKGISFYHCNILAVDPKVLATLREKGLCFVDFHGNVCVNNYFPLITDTKCLGGLDEQIMNTCIEIFKIGNAAVQVLGDLTKQNSIMNEKISNIVKKTNTLSNDQKNETATDRNELVVEMKALIARSSNSSNEKTKQYFLPIFIVLILLILLGIVVVTLLIIALRKLSQNITVGQNQSVEHVEYQFEGYDTA